MHPRIHEPDDVASLDAFLARHSDSSLFLRSNLRAAGLRDDGRPFSGLWLCAETNGNIVAVAVHGWNGMLLLQAPVHTEELSLAAMRRSRRSLAGIAGPWSQVELAAGALGLDGEACAYRSRERLYALDLTKLASPELLRADRVEVRRTCQTDLDVLTAWRVAYRLETLGCEPGPTLDHLARVEIDRAHYGGVAWVAVEAGELRSFSTFNATLPHVVQIGGVYTPVGLRGRGWGRSVVAGSLCRAEAAGVRRAVLFTPEANLAAQKAYESIGFLPVGDYGIVVRASGLPARIAATSASTCAACTPGSTSA